MEAAGDQIGKIGENIAKNIDAKANGDIQGQIGLAEELGRSASMASAAGVGGSSIEAYNSTVRLRAAMGQEQGDRAFASDLHAANLDRGNTLVGAVAGLDNNVYRANLDYRRWADPHKQSMLSKIAEVGLTAAATYFGGPQAGQAVMGVFDAGNMAANGDFAGAASTFDGAVANGVGAYQTTRSMGGNTFWSKPSATVPQVSMAGGADRHGEEFWNSTRNPFNVTGGSYQPFIIH